MFKVSLDEMEASEEISMMVLRKADAVRQNQRQRMCHDYALRNGVFGRV